MSELITIDEAVENELLFEMVNIKSRRTGLPYDLWLDSAGVSRATKHNMPRIKVNVDGTLIPIEVSDNPCIPSSVNVTKEIKHKMLVLRYIKAYKEILLAHFNNQIDDKDALDLLGPLTQAKEQTLKLSDIIDVTEQCVAYFRYNTDELLYEIELKNNNTLIATAYELQLHDVISKIGEWQEEFNIVKIVDEDKLIPETTL